MTLHILTAFFPFGSAESFFAEELEYLSKDIEKIVIYPGSGCGMSKRSYPSNCIVDERLCESKYKKLAIGLVNLWCVAPIYLKEYKTAFANKANFVKWLKSMLGSAYLSRSSVIKDIEKFSSDEDVIYSYWGSVSNNYLPFYKGKAKTISRFHGEGDLWKGKDKEGYIPLRLEIVKKITCAVFVSRMGETFFKNKYPQCRTITFHLGSQDFGVGQRSKDGVLRIVSCSSIYPLKRVSLIYDSICKIDGLNILWTHIGNGMNGNSVYDEELKNHVENNPKSNVKVCLKGWMAHADVYEFYKSNPVDLFINLSTNEGVPVSIMEAISFNIPVVATDVGGNSEIVKPETGRLVSPNPSEKEVAEAIRYVYSNNYLPREYWSNEFNADVNYPAFSNFLRNLKTL